MGLSLSAKIVAFYSGADNGSALAVHLCTFGALFLHFYFTINKPAALAPTNTDSAQKYAVSGTLVVRIPYRFAWEELPPIEMSLDVRSQWQAKF